MYKVGRPLRLRSVRLKSGGAAFHIMRTPTAEQDRANVEYWVKHTLDAHDARICGMALVVWDQDCASTATLRANPGSPIPGALIPDFVRNRLLAEKIEEWTIMGLRNSGAL